MNEIIYKFTSLIAIKKKKKYLWQVNITVEKMRRRERRAKGNIRGKTRNLNGNIKIIEKFNSGIKLSFFDTISISNQQIF